LPEAYVRVSNPLAYGGMRISSFSSISCINRLLHKKQKDIWPAIHLNEKALRTFYENDMDSSLHLFMTSHNFKVKSFCHNLITV